MRASQLKPRTMSSLGNSNTNTYSNILLSPIAVVTPNHHSNWLFVRNIIIMHSVESLSCFFWRSSDYPSHRCFVFGSMWFRSLLLSTVCICREAIECAAIKLMSNGKDFAFVVGVRDNRTFFHVRSSSNLFLTAAVFILLLLLSSMNRVSSC